MRIVIGWREYRPRWGDGQVVLKLRPLSNAALLETMPHFQELQPEEGETLARGLLVKVLNIQAAAKDLLPEFCQVAAGLEDETGQPITAAQLTEMPVFADLVLEVMSELIAMSRLGTGDRGNSSGPAADGGPPETQAP